MAHAEPGQDVWNRFWAQKKDLDKTYPSSPSVQKAILKNMDPKGLSVLEVGAGTGRDSAELARRGAQVTVLDFAQGALGIVGELRDHLGLEDHLRLVRGDAFHAPFPENSFDLVFHQGLAEHFRDPLPLLQENFRLVKPGGFCLCDVPQTFHIYTLIKHLLIAMDKWFAGWETQFTMPQLETLMRSAGFEIHYHYGDWMRPNLAYRILREIFMKVGVRLPKYPLDDTAWQRAKDGLLDLWQERSWAHFTQLSIGVIGRKPR
ncbi:MAG TPA: class I SAM-dependent methyltransferase [Fibrobacteraceae bacterium]|nr:class I SAM-dependent methyltransferase [Fibrobacteraceae bacterium]